jgi:hypothetical protein
MRKHLNLTTLSFVCGSWNTYYIVAETTYMERAEVKEAQLCLEYLKI